MTTLVKIGGSVLTDKRRPLAFQQAYARGVAADIRLSGTVPVIVHGTGSWAKAIGRHYQSEAGWFRDATGFELTCLRIRRLQEALAAALREEGVVCCPLQANALFHRVDGNLELYATGPITRLVEAGVSPLLCGDLLVEGPGVFRVVSSDAIAVVVARRLAVSDCVFATDVDGVWDFGGKLIPELTEPELAVSDSDRRDVTGGMSAKVVAAMDIAAIGTHTTIVNGRVRGRVRDALIRRNVIGTRVISGVSRPDDSNGVRPSTPDRVAAPTALPASGRT